jgi:NAD(P)-dependent dehydrogenase (short-subunit alcohol dehydrogenase family)
LASALGGKVIAITGAGSGIGRALALGLAARGAKLALSDKDAAGLAETRRLLGNHHNIAEVFDVRQADGWASFAFAAVQAFGHVDGIINNAGLSVVAPFEDMSEDDFDLVMDVNFRGVVRGTRTFLPLVGAQPKGWVVNISSVFGLMGFPTQTSYCASKSAVKCFTETLRLELAQTRPTVQVMQVHPGGIKTNVAKNAKYIKSLGTKVTSHAQSVDQFAANAPTTPEQAAETIIAAMESGETRVRIGGDAKVIDWLTRLFPKTHITWLDRLSGGKLFS